MTTRESLDRAFDLRGTPRGTRDAYGWCINRYEGYFGRPASALGREEVETFLLHLVRERKLGPSTHNVYAAALRFVYGAALGRPEVTAGIPRRKTPMRLPMLLSPEQIARLLGAVADRHQQPATGVPTRRAGDLPHEGRQGHHAGRPGLPRPFHPARTAPRLRQDPPLRAHGAEQRHDQARPGSRSAESNPDQRARRELGTVDQRPGRRGAALAAALARADRNRCPPVPCVWRTRGRASTAERTAVPPAPLAGGVSSQRRTCAAPDSLRVLPVEPVGVGALHDASRPPRAPLTCLRKVSSRSRANPTRPSFP